MTKPLICINFKTHPQAFGDGAKKLATIMDAIANEYDVRLIAAVSAFDLSSISSKCEGLEVWCQHLDAIKVGSNTGSLLPQNAQYHGASGTLLNHAENKISLETIENTLKLVPEDMITCVCAADVEQARAIAAFGPNMIAVEPPELIGGDISVTTADPDIIRNTVEAVKSVNSDVNTNVPAELGKVIVLELALVMLGLFNVGVVNVFEVSVCVVFKPQRVSEVEPLFSEGK